jgi:arylsulfatase A-like enzyme
LKYSFVHDVLALKKKLEWKNETSMADVLKAAKQNYITAHFGKGMGNEKMDSIGYDVTDEYDIGPNGNFHGEKRDLKTREPLPDDDPKRLPTLNTRSHDFVREHAGKRPFYMMLSHYAVHVPHHASERLIEKYRKLPRGKYCKDEDYGDPAEMGKGFKGSSWRLQYAAMIDEIDEGLGAIVAALEQAGELANTYIIYSSDNGGGLKPNGPLSWGKAQLYEGGLRVPFVIAGPGVKAGVQCDVPIVQWDLLPTLHDLSGSKATLPANLDGASLHDLFKNGNAGSLQRPSQGLVFHYPCYFAPPLSVIRIGDFKYMRHLLTGDVQLFDLSKDIGEKQNLARTMPEKAAAMEQVLSRYLESIDAEDVQDVYQARFEQLDHFEAMAGENYARKAATASGAELTELKADLAKDRKRFADNRKEVHANMKATHWAGGIPNR